MVVMVMMVMMVVVVMVMIVMMMVVVMMVVVVVLSKFDVRVPSFRSGQTRGGSRGVHSRQEGERIRDGIEELSIRPRRWQPIRIIR